MCASTLVVCAGEEMLQKFRVSDAILAGQPPMLASNVALHQHGVELPRCIVQQTLPCMCALGK